MELPSRKESFYGCSMSFDPLFELLPLAVFDAFFVLITTALTTGSDS